MKQIDLGGMPFADLRENDMYYVDKTLLIKDLLEFNDRGAYLFTRPRRFGKTTNLSMLDAFFNIEYKGNTWFDGLAISEYPEFERYKNAFPVIRLNLNDTGACDHDSFIHMMRDAVAFAFDSHRYLLDGPDADPCFAEFYRSVARLEVEEDFLATSMQDLSEAIFDFTGKKPIILIDGYDNAVSDNFGNESYRRTLDFLGDFLRSTLETNRNLQMAYMTGVMQIAPQSLCDLDLVSVNGVLSDDPGERFGFTESEVGEALRYYGHEGKLDEVREWYDGYRFGDARVYSPFCIMTYIRNRCEPDSYWIDSGGDRIMRDLLTRIDDTNMSAITDLVLGNAVRMELDRSLMFGDPYASDRSVFSLMAMTGYLNAVPAGDDRYEVRIPNKEVLCAIWRTSGEVKPMTGAGLMEFNQAVLEGDAKWIASLIEGFLTTDDYLDRTGEAPKNPREMTVVILLVALRKRYTVRIGRRADYRRFDAVLVPKTQGGLGMVMGIRIAGVREDPATGADAALEQIRDADYRTEFSGEVLLIGICFKNGTAEVRFETVTVRGDAGWSTSRRG